MSSLNTTKPSASYYIKAVCVAAEDMGIITTMYGTRPMVKLTFETEELNEYGQKRRYTRLFHKHTHEKSALSIVAKSWCNRDLGLEEENIGDIDVEAFVDTPACIKLEPGAVKNGKHYKDITEILPVRDEVEATCETKENE